jgi:hypothetical protein
MRTGTNLVVVGPNTTQGTVGTWNFSGIQISNVTAKAGLWTGSWTGLYELPCGLILIVDTLIPHARRRLAALTEYLNLRS